MFAALTAQGKAGSVSFLQQQEVGIKQRGGVFGGSCSVEVTGLYATLTENNLDFTRINNPAPNNDPNISNSYRSFGVEFTSRVTAGNVHFAVDATHANSRIADSATAAAAAWGRHCPRPRRCSTTRRCMAAR